MNSVAESDAISRRAEWILGALALSALVFIYADVFAALANMWRSSPMYSYGPLIPIISGYLIWARREHLRLLSSRPSAWGWLVLGVGVLALVAGRAGGVIVLQELSLIPTIAGLVLLLLGWAHLQALSGPIAYLIFMIPVWDGLTERLHLPFQFFSAENGLWLLNLVGIPAYRDGLLLELPNLTMEVARACSGVNYLVAVVAIGIPLATLYLDSWGRRVVLLVSAVLIAIAANSVRVALIGVLAYYEIGSPLHGPFHVLQGLFVAVVGYGALFGGLWVLSRGRSVDRMSRKQGPPPPPNSVGPTNRLGVLVGLVGLSLALVGYTVWDTPPPVPPAHDLATFPRQVGEWMSSPAPNERAIAVVATPDQELRRRYVRTSGDEVHVYVGYFESQTQGKEVFDHRSTDLHLRARHASVWAGDESRTVNAVIGRDRDGSYAALFWYDLNGRVIADRYRAKLYSVWDALVYRRTNGMVVWLRMDVPVEADQPSAIGTLTEFAEVLFPLLKSHVGEKSALAVHLQEGTTS